MNPNVSLFHSFPVFSTFEVVLVHCCLIFILVAMVLTSSLLFPSVTALILLSILSQMRSDIALLLQTHQLYLLLSSLTVQHPLPQCGF